VIELGLFVLWDLVVEVGNLIEVLFSGDGDVLNSVEMDVVCIGKGL
jgi:hypothetical protein